MRCLCLSRHPDHCAWFEECDASALWLGPIDVGDGFMYTTYEVWGRAETVKRCRCVRMMGLELDSEKDHKVTNYLR